ncbi:MAG: hypothetical protein VYD85_10015, partial [Pseudomonadota bacterium]|nr:hypothetical protein [Pseudomonadota bacterium]
CLFRSTGFCAKVLYKAIEEIDDTQVEAVTATGAGLVRPRECRRPKYRESDSAATRQPHRCFSSMTRRMP